MTAFDHPSSQPSRRERDAFRRLRALLQGGRIPLRLTGAPRRFPRVSFVAAEVLWGVIPENAAAQDASRQGRGQQRDLRRLGAAHDERPRDATPVHQQAALAPIVFPDPWGSVPQLLARVARWSALHRDAASPRRCPASRHPPSVRLATAVRRSLPAATPKNTGESRSDCRSVLWATLSIGSRCGGRRRSRQTPVGAARVSARHPACGDIPAAGRAVAWESTARPSAKNSRRFPMSERVSCSYGTR